MSDGIEDWLREAAETPADPLGVLELLFQPGRSVTFTGERGGGKTHCAIGLNELNVKLHPGSGSVLMTNIIFNQVAGIEPNGYWEPGCRVTWRPRVWPQEVVHVTSLEQVFRLTGEILERKNDWMDDEAFCIYQLKDEFQNFVMADRSYEPLVQAYYTYEGNLRKIRHCDQKISPSIYNIPKRLRRFVDDISYAGYMSAHVHKEKFLVEDFNQCWGTHVHPRYFASVQLGYDHRPELIESPTVSWNRPVHLLEEGDVIYDHLSSATFRLSARPAKEPKDEFQFQGLIEAIGGVASMEVPTAINRFFDRRDAEDDYDPGADKDLEMCSRVRELLRLKDRKGLKLTWEDIARIEGRKRSTVQMLYQRYSPHLDEVANGGGEASSCRI